MQWKKFGKRKGDDMTVDILGTTWKIKKKKLHDMNLDGWTDYTKKVIVLRSDNYHKLGDFEANIRKQLRHELIHAFLGESGLQSNFEHCTQFGHDETMVDWFAIQYPKIQKVYKDLNIDY